MPKEKKTSDEFREEAKRPRKGLLVEFWDFVVYNKAWWMLPVLAVLLLLGALAFLGSSGISPWLYTLF